MALQRFGRLLLVAFLFIHSAMSQSGELLDIAGTKTYNISSDSTQLSYLARWRSDTEDGFYQAYSNRSDASVTFSFIGVAAQYIAVRKDDRGLCQITIDESISYTIDLYDGSGYTQGRQIIWSSGTLLYGIHNVTLTQIGPDARLGFYPYLFTETWIEYVPNNVSDYTATQSYPMPTSTGSSSNDESSSTNVAPIIGGVVGGVVALALLTFLIFLWRRDKAARARGDGGHVQKVKRADGKMAIEDERPYGRGVGWDGGAHHQAYGGAGAGAAHYGSGGSWGEGHHSTDGSYNSQHGLLPSGAAYGAAGPPTSPSSPHNSAYGAYPARPYDPVPYRGVTPESYPYVVQGTSEEKRMYPVPEI